MVTFEDVARLALALPETEETTSWGRLTWAVRSGGKAKPKGFVWERPLSKKDQAFLTAEGAEVPPNEVILGVRVDGLAEKEAILAENPETTFTTPHFNGYPAVLVRLDRLDDASLKEIVTDAWLAVAPRKLADQFSAEQAGT
ncbi:MAG: MmcQ/YjbR family DNA-binding protein [Microlunatus sp.]